ncbi:branched-chain amino acid ABC transporter permease [Candidatus Leptofilum sp.]|uniref:branched-chain amino acid ABC transporter permease n=1 Tax=Candidatus Leptofilum sp. TaxID=3241576 RepID=UPI003B5CEC04
MQSTLANRTPEKASLARWLSANRGLVGLLIFLLLFPFLLALIEGQSFGDVLANEAGRAKFMQGLLIEVFILAIYALSYDLILGVTGLLSFGHAMFFATGAYFTGIAFKSFGWGAGQTLLGLVGVAVVQALLFGIVLPRVKGITFALVTLGLASVFHIVVQASELTEWTGADVGLQGVIAPDWLNSNTARFQLYLLVLVSTFVVYLIYRRFVDSPTGRVCIAIRENEDRALMLGYNTFLFKLVALIVASLTAVLAGFFHTIHQPIVSPNVAGLGWTVAALLIILIGGVGTLSGALVGAAVFRLLEYYLDLWFGDAANFLLGAVYVIIVLFLPYGIVGTWRLRSTQIAKGRERLKKLFGLTKTIPKS